MGKRKERRLAAKSNAGRRVKLDLFAQPQPQSQSEPSGGDLGGSSVHDDDDDVVGGDTTDSKLRKASPNSPSSSGQQPQNPLLLLNQYSDDDVDGEPSKGHNIRVEREGSMTNDEAGGALEGDSEDADIVDQKNEHGTVPCSSLGDQGCHRNEPNAASSDSPQRQLDSSDIASVGASDVQLATDTGLVWKMVLHEESKQYYYWNTESGETSWEVPQGFSQATLNSQTALAASNDKAKSSSLGVETSHVMGNSQTSLRDGSCSDNLIAPGDGVDGPAFHTDGWREEHKIEPVEGGSLGTDAKGQLRSPVFNAPHIGDGSINVDSKHDVDRINFPFLLVKMGEMLLEKLKSMHELQSHLHCQDSLSKLILEVEIRLSDIKSLASYGKSLFPFWLHSEKHLKNVEMFIGGDKTLTLGQAEHADEVDEMHLSLTEGQNKLQRSMDHESGVDKVEKIVVPISENAHVSSSTGVAKDFYDTSASDAEHGSSPVHVTKHTVTAGPDKDSSQVNGTASAESSQKHGCDEGDDMDMDVDMEDEYAHTSFNTAAACPLIVKDCILSDQLAHCSVPVECHSSITQDHFVIPPPPDEEWIPPPPPDNELEPPPPPPDDPSEALHSLLPSFPETGQTLVYGERNNLPYPGANFEYYAHTSADGNSNNLYGDVQGNQIAISQPQFYYSAIPGSYAENMLGNLVEPELFYNLQSNAAPVVPVDRMDSSGYSSESAIVHKSVSFSAVTSSSFVPNVTTDIPGVDGGANKALNDVPSFSSAIQAHAGVSAEINVSAPSTTSVHETIASAPSLSKVQSKALRGKKRTVSVASSLRSNKKVSSLVDKWKAAKEELLEDEEEPETGYEFLERKKQKEIEEWRAKQIASGDARDNANFQPLGGDWREKVKRKRTQHKSEVFEREKNIECKKQPNLIEISRELPSGWQAYWDESSKQVYYGNPTTSETTWTKPTK